MPVVVRRVRNCVDSRVTGGVSGLVVEALVVDDVSGIVVEALVVDVFGIV